MTTRWRRQWRALRASRPGERFQDRYRAGRRGDDARPWVGRIVRLALACGALALGVVFVLLPGPAVVFFFAAGALLAPESLTIARAMDGLEVLVRRVVAALRQRWARLSRAAKFTVGGGLALATATAALGGYRLVFR